MKPNQSLSFLVTATGEHCLRLKIADRFFSRLRGLMLAAPLQIGEGMLLLKCKSVHTFFMRQHVDLLYLDEAGFVTKCVPYLRPWRASTSRGKDAFGNPLRPAMHVVELTAGSIARWKIRYGSRLRLHALNEAAHSRSPSVDCKVAYIHPAHSAHQAQPVDAVDPIIAHNVTSIVKRHKHTGQRGSAMIEFAVVAPILTLIGLASVQYGLLFFAKNQYNHAAFMAARAGSTGNANLEVIKDAYARALIPLYGGGTDTTQLAASLKIARDDVNANTQIEMLNPTAESFLDFNDYELQKAIGSSTQRVIPNGGLAYKKAAIVPGNSGQNIQDANLLKLRITQAYKPQVPVVGAMYTRYLQWLDNGVRAFDSQKINLGFIPVVTNVTLQMQSDAIEGKTVSTPGFGNGGVAVDPGMPPPPTAAPPSCSSAFCTRPVQAGQSNGHGGTGTTDPVTPSEVGGGGNEATPGICIAPVMGSTP